MVAADDELAKIPFAFELSERLLDELDPEREG
jgi:hypothetical protein